MSPRPVHAAVVLSAVTAILSPFTLLTPGQTASADTFASSVVSFDPGTGGASGFDNPFVTLGSPTRFTGEGVFPGVVSPFNPPYMPTEIVSIGEGGHLTVSFANPILNNTLNPFGIDFIIFGNTGFIDGSFPNAIVAGLFGNDGGIVEVSQDGIIWHTVPGVEADGMFPTMGYLDSGPFDTTPGSVLTDFTRPVDPSLTLADFMGLDYAGVMALYDGSGGGTGVDISSVGLEWIQFIRVSNPVGSGVAIEIDAFSRVTAIPTPGVFALLIGGLLTGTRRRREVRCA